MKILVVDDSRAMRLMVQRAVKQTSYETAEFVEAADGVEALDKVAGVDVVFSDWNMPNMTGIELLRALRERDCEVPFGFVTSETTVEASAEAFDSGACFHVTKPFNPEALEVAIDWALGKLGTDAPALPPNVRVS